MAVEPESRAAELAVLAISVLSLGLSVHRVVKQVKRVQVAHKLSK